ncbi:dihydrodipicolinate reductase [Marimonas sp. MJW-29]|uniref:Dihydrodipicolinate reductase n=1 Tax=Sulfitobacter sediminis TaxID=3234186 RepID=A0ABV3RLP5_9RHOB
MKAIIPSVIAAVIGLATPAFADFQQITSRDDFLRLVGGKTLTRPLVKLQVLPDGRIAGTGASWEVTGQWSWENGYLCRSLKWGGDDLGYNCQEVKTDGARVRITSDKGKGDSADFLLR